MVYPRRLSFLFLGALILAGFGLFWLNAYWTGLAGRSPADLYVPGNFGTRAPLLRLVRLPTVPGEGRRDCFAVQPLRSATPADTTCSGDGEGVLMWVGNGALSVRVGDDGFPRASLVGARLTVGEWIGSGANPHGAGTSPRFPLRGYGIASRAARVVPCARPNPAPPPVACIEVDDPLERLALARAVSRPGGEEARLAAGEHEIRSGDELWLGLVPFLAAVHSGAKDGGPVLSLVRIDRLRPGTADTAADLFVRRGGDRRWLGRLWPLDPPGREMAEPDTVFVHPMAVRYTRGHLSRQRVNFELEDVMQRLVDGQWLCLDHSDSVPRLAWRPLDAPGCTGAANPEETVAYTRAQAADYRMGRSPRLLVARLVEQTNRFLAERAYLRDPSLLPMAFEWGLRRADGGDAAREEPVPLRLWGVRFGAARILPEEDTSSSPSPLLALRASTARHVVQLFAADTMLASLYLTPGLRQAGGPLPRGSICLAAGVPTGAVDLDAADGGHHPLGSVFITSQPTRLRWMPAGAPCEGCQLEVAAAAGDTALAVNSVGHCPGLTLAGARPARRLLLLHADEELAWDAGRMRLRYARRHDPPWIALAEPATGERRFAEEFYGPAGLEPLVGNASGTGGLEAALRDFVRDGGGARSHEISIDGDLQLAVARIVERHAGDSIKDVLPALWREAQVSAVVLDAWTGEVLAAANWSWQGARALHGMPPNAWELGSGQAVVVPNAAFVREEAIGSMFKIGAAYALANSGMVQGGPLTLGPRSEGRLETDPEGHAAGALYLATADARGDQHSPSRRKCSTGPHLLPASVAGYTTGTFVERFARSCNSFFVMTGLRLASRPPAVLRPPGAGGAYPQAGELLLRAGQDQRLTLVLPTSPTLADRIRDGLAGDAYAGAAAPPKSVYGVLFRAGFHPQPTPGEDLPASEYGFAYGGRDVRVPLSAGWFGVPGGIAPMLEPGVAFSYPSLPSAARLDEAAEGGRGVDERFGGAVRRVTRSGGEGLPETLFAQLMIGQSLQASALGTAVLYAPAARRDGRSVRPCIFTAGCGTSRAGPVVLDVTPQGQAAVLNSALRAVVTGDGTAAGKLGRAGLGWLSMQWGGKTGTFEREISTWPALRGQERVWEDLVAHACGVTGIAPAGLERLAVVLDGSAPGLEAAVRRLASAPPGSALGAVACEARGAPFVPGGIHGYRITSAARDLDVAAAGVRTLQEDSTTDFHAFALVNPPRRGGWPARESPAEGLVVVVLVDDEADIAVEIGGRIAAAAERWAATSGRSLPRPN